MLTYTKEAAEEELALAEIAYQDALESGPTDGSLQLVQLEGRQSCEAKQLVARQQALLQATYEKHRVAVQELKEKHAEVISQMFQSQREEKTNLLSVHAEQKSAVRLAIGSERAEHKGRIAAAKQRVTNAKYLLSKLEQRGQ